MVRRACLACDVITRVRARAASSCRLTSRHRAPTSTSISILTGNWQFASQHYSPSAVVSVPSVLFHHVSEFYYELAFFILLAGFERVLLKYNIVISLVSKQINCIFNINKGKGWNGFYFCLFKINNLTTATGVAGVER